MKVVSVEKFTSVFTGIAQALGASTTSWRRTVRGAAAHSIWRSMSPSCGRSTSSERQQMNLPGPFGGSSRPKGAGVIVPGEVEARKEEQRSKEGVPIRDEDWQGVLDTATRLGVEAASA